MEQALTIALVVALVAVVAVLLVGVFAMARSGSFNKRYGNKLMRARVGLQLLAIVLFVLVIIVSRS